MTEEQFWLIIGDMCERNNVEEIIANYGQSTADYFACRMRTLGKGIIALADHGGDEVYVPISTLTYVQFHCDGATDDGGSQLVAPAANDSGNVVRLVS